MKIAIIAEVYLPKVDGVVLRTLNLVRHLLDQGHEILVICPDQAEPCASPVPVFGFRSFPFPAYPEYRIGLPDQRLVNVLGSFAPDIIHFINPFAFGFRCCDILAKSGLSFATMFSFHTLYGEFVKQYPMIKPLAPMLWWLTRDYHNTATRNLTVSAVMQHELTQRGFKRVDLWPPAVDCGRFHPDRFDAGLRRRFTQDQPDQKVLLTVSRLAPEKNVAFLVPIIRRLQNVSLAIVGDGPDRPTLERKFAGTNTQFFGYMTGDELPAAYASADAFMYASETETMGNVILEAMASGLSVIAPCAGGIASLVTHRHDGLLYSPSNLQDAESAVFDVLSDGLLRKTLGRNARATVEQWGWDRSIQRVQEYYAETIEDFRRGCQITRRRRWLAPTTVRALVLSFRLLSLVKRRQLGNHGRPSISTSMQGGSHDA